MFRLFKLNNINIFLFYFVAGARLELAIPGHEPVVLPIILTYQSG